MKLNYIIIPILVLLTSVLGSKLTSADMTWYKTLKLPNIAPPGYVIGAVWTVIFILSAIAIIIIWNKISHQNSIFGLLIVLIIINGILNILWSYLFFTQHLIGWALIEMIILEISVLAIIILTWPLARLASILFMPYAVWVCFATYLTTQIYLLNK